ncbi:MAG: hypothetical protein GX640_06055 [Fibrobacter sp.]|nr:hypothetical protein [Fibrobacter sp.]
MILPVSRLLRTIILAFSIVCMTGQIVHTFADGYPSEHLVTQRWHYLFSNRSALSNPSFINEENYFSGKYVFASTLGEFYIHEVGAVYPIGLYQSVGASFIMQRDPNVDGTDNAGNPIGMLNSNKTNILLSYANNLWKGLTLGANLQMVMNSNFGQTTIGLTGDVGLSLRVLNNPILGNHVIGVNLQNVVPILDETPPRTLRISLNSDFLEHRGEFGLEWALKDIGSPVDYFADGVAIQEWELNFRAGAWLFHALNLNILGSLSADGLESFGGAVGVNLPFINNGRDLTFIAQYLNILDNDYNASTTSLYVRFNAGKHREEVYARLMARKTDTRPNDLYLRAVELYNARNYWDAFFLFSQLFVEYPDFFRNDYVSYFIGSCQENLDMRITAQEAYNKAKEMYPNSAAIPMTDLGLMRIQYRNGNYSAVETQFNELNKLGVPDSIKYHGYYLMGEAELKKKNHSKAKQLFGLIPETHPDYVFAQHSASVADALDGNMENALSSLESAIQAPTTTAAQKEIVNRSYIFLGYLFYEVFQDQEGALAKAVTAMRSVPKSSIYYPDALLGLGWTALKARQWNDCKAAGAELASVATSPVLKAEGLLLQAYALSMNKEYQSASDLLRTALSGLESYKVPEKSELTSQEQEFNRLQSEYTGVARKAYDLATARQSELVKNQIDSLATHQKDYSKKIKEHIAYVDAFEKAIFFARNIETVKEDVEYALAKFTRMAGKGAIDKKSEKLDDELERLRKELEETSGGE